VLEQEELKLLFDTLLQFLCGAPRTLISVKQKVKAAGHDWPEIKLEEEWGGEGAAGKTVLTHPVRHLHQHQRRRFGGMTALCARRCLTRVVVEQRWAWQVDVSVLGAVALGLIAHHFRWALPTGVAVGGIFDPCGGLGALMGVTSEHVECAERAGVRRLYMSPRTEIDGASGEPPVVVRLTNALDLIEAVWEEGR
jgi:hypothetical protein